MESLSREKQIEQTINEKIVKFEEQRVAMQSQYQFDIKLETFSEKDKDGNHTGNVFAAFVQQPHILVAAKCMDMMVARNFYQCGNLLWESCIMKESSPEISNITKYKLGMQGQLGLLLDAQAPDIKKN